MTPTSFTHGSTAVFGLAIAGYTVLRIASYAVADLPLHLGTPSPQAKAQVHDIVVPRHDGVGAGRSDHRALPPATHRHTATTVRTAIAAHVGTALHIANAVHTTHHDATAAPADSPNDDSATSAQSVSSPAQPEPAAASDDTTSADQAPAAQPVVASAAPEPATASPTPAPATASAAPFDDDSSDDAEHEERHR
jgi:hypothetical protein